MSGQKILDGLKDALAGNIAAITVRIPIPPSVNNLFRNAGKKGRIRTERYKTWSQVAGIRVNLAQQRPIPGEVVAEIIVQRPKDGRARCDLDNLAKAPLDLLVRHGLIEDDDRVVDLRIRYGDVEGCLVTVRPA